MVSQFCFAFSCNIVGLVISYFGKAYFLSIEFVRVLKSVGRNLRARAHQGKWQQQRNLNFQEISPIPSRQLVSRLAGAHLRNLCLISCSYHLKWVRSSDVMHD
jgi:hypothetical protein